MTTTAAATPSLVEDEPAEDELDYAIREYVRTYVRWCGRHKAMETFGVPRHTLWRFLDRDHLGRVLPRAVLNGVGDSVEAVDAATWAIAASERITANANRSARNRRPEAPALRLGQEDALLQLCAAPLQPVTRHHFARQAGKADGTGTGGFRVPPSGRSRPQAPAPLLPHERGNPRRRSP